MHPSRRTLREMFYLADREVRQLQDGIPALIEAPRMHQLPMFLTGFLLGLGLVLPMGPINLFVLRQGLCSGWKRAWPTVMSIAINDTVMIALGAAAGTAATSAFEAIQKPLMLAGAVYLTALGVRYLRLTGASMDPEAASNRSLRQRILLTVGVVWLNPQALFDVFGVLGTAIGTRDESVRSAFVLGVIAASWIWYAALACGAGVLRHRLTTCIARRIDRLSGGMLLLFAGFLWAELVR